MTVEDAVAEQLVMTNDTWAALQDEGVDEGSSLSLDFFFVDGDEQSARALQLALSDEVAQLDVTTTKVGIFKKRQVWSVNGTTKPFAVSLPVLRDWVVRMVRLGAEHGLEFDGWGAEVPGP